MAECKYESATRDVFDGLKNFSFVVAWYIAFLKVQAFLKDDTFV